MCECDYILQQTDIAIDLFNAGAKIIKCITDTPCKHWCTQTHVIYTLILKKNIYICHYQRLSLRAPKWNMCLRSPIPISWERRCSGVLKNRERYTAHTIVSWPNPKPWVIVQTSYLMMVLRQSIYILHQVSQFTTTMWFYNEILTYERQVSSQGRYFGVWCELRVFRLYSMNTPYQFRQW